MKLVNTKTGFVVAEFNGDSCVFFDPFLEKEMARSGIVIPPFLQPDFGGKSRIRLRDREFQRAFKEVYCALTLDRG